MDFYPHWPPFICFGLSFKDMADDMLRQSTSNVMFDLVVIDLVGICVVKYLNIFLYFVPNIITGLRHALPDGLWSNMVRSQQDMPCDSPIRFISSNRLWWYNDVRHVLLYFWLSDFSDSLPSSLPCNSL